MARLSLSSVARLALLTCSGALIVWALVQMFSVPPDLGELEVRVENADLRLRADEYVLQIFDSASGALVAAGGTSDVTTLAPGEYDLRVMVPGVWPEQMSNVQGLAVPGGRRTRVDFDFSFGELDLHYDAARLSNSAELVKIQVFTEPRSDTPVISFIAGETVKLEAGRYNLRVVRTVETREKQVRWLEGVDIKQGRQRTVAVAFERGLLQVDATNAGATILAADGTVSVFAAGDNSQKIIETGPLNVPIVLPTGTYDLRVTYDRSDDRPVRSVRSVVIVDAETQRVHVEFDSGELVVHARTAAGELLPEYHAYIYLYQRSDHRNAIAYVPAGHPLRLSAGRYDIRANLFRSADRPDVWLRDVAIVPNELLELETIFHVGEFIVRVIDQNGREHSGDEFSVTLHPSENGDRAIYRTQVGKRIRISLGPVGVQVENTYTGNSEWLESEIVPGEITEIVVDARSESH